MTEPERGKPNHDEWGGGWEARRRQQLVAGLSATPAQRLVWLEEMIVLAYRTGALPRPRPDSTTGA